MAKPISEQALEDVVVAELVKAGYLQRQTSAYEKSLCLDAGPQIDFIQATQPIPTRRVSEGPSLGVNIADLPSLTRRVVKGDCGD